MMYEFFPNHPASAFEVSLNFTLSQFQWSLPFLIGLCCSHLPVHGRTNMLNSTINRLVKLISQYGLKITDIIYFFSWACSS